MTSILSRQTMKADECALDALRDAEPTPFWLDSPEAPTPHPALTGLWAALQAK
jgi:hypothetical protein